MKKTVVLAIEEDLLVDLTFHNVPASILTEFAQKIVLLYYNGNLTVAIRGSNPKADAGSFPYKAYSCSMED